jgi:hypothetical protein
MTEAHPVVFISYRRSDSPGSARDLAAACSARFGSENVFYDARELVAGANWAREIQQRIAEADVVLAVIGPNWAPLAEDRSRRADGVDVLRTEIESAVRAEALLIPVLVDDAALPERDSLPRPFRSLISRQAFGLRHATWDRDVEELLRVMEESAAARRSARERVAVTSGAAVPPGAPAVATYGNVPDEGHFDDIVEYLEDGLLVPVLGPGVYEPDPERAWEAGCGWLPSASELARALAERFRLDPSVSDLTRVSQHIELKHGPADLHRALRRMLLRPEYEPSPVHRFWARVPALLRARGMERCPLILTTNYDTALERAFDEAQEPFDLAVYMASGPHKSKFLHIPWWDGKGSRPRAIENPNGYIDFPVYDDGDLTRTIVVKIHGGALHDAPRSYEAKDNFVITEDDYIGYLSHSPVESLVPVQILDKLRESHLLFQGYGVRDWNLRVFLRRIWLDERRRANSWAVQRDLDTIDRSFWEVLDVARFDVPLARYLDELNRRLEQ